LTGALFGRSSRYVGRLCRSSMKKSSGISGISEYEKIPTGIMKKYKKKCPNDRLEEKYYEKNIMRDLAYALPCRCRSDALRLR
jgi:hypothetical protein